MAEPTGLEPATSDVTGRRSNQLNYDSALSNRSILLIYLTCSLSGSRFPEFKVNRHGGTRTHNFHLVRVAVYH